MTRFLLVVALGLTACDAPAVTDPCSPATVDTVVVADGPDMGPAPDTLVVSAQLCLTPPIGRGWNQ